jgi:stage II sporulation protein AA (anti-sigma F factor antagonist)
MENGPGNPFEIHEHEDEDGVLRVSVMGELDVATAPELQRRLTRARVARHAVRVDLSSLGFMDSSGIQVLVAALLDARAADVGFELDSTLSPSVARVLDISGVRSALLGTKADAV